jgi:hypothetical protein
LRISELDAREDHDAIAARTLTDAWERQYGQQFRVSFGRHGRGQQWRQQNLLSAWITSSAGPEVRRFLADSFRHTQVKHRQVPQWLAGTALASRVGLAVTSRSVFTVDPALPDTHNLLILPGNRRIRFFDFGSGKSRVALKDGFDDTAMSTELGVRGGGQVGPFPPILRSGSGWFEEDIIDGLTLSRCPPRLDRATIDEVALARLEAWGARSAESVDTASYIDSQVEVVTALAEGRLALPKNLAETVSAIQSQTVIQDSHGDCQPGNIIIEQDGSNPLFIDWEYHGRRSRHYDRVVFGTGLRWPANLSERLRKHDYYVAGASSATLNDLPGGEARRALIVTALLEDVVWRLKTWKSGPKAILARGIPSEVGPVIQAIWGAFEH